MKRSPLKCSLYVIGLGGSSWGSEIFCVFWVALKDRRICSYSFENEWRRLKWGMALRFWGFECRMRDFRWGLMRYWCFYLQRPKALNIYPFSHNSFSIFPKPFSNFPNPSLAFSPQQSLSRFLSKIHPDPKSLKNPKSHHFQPNPNPTPKSQPQSLPSPSLPCKNLTPIV